MRVSQTTLLLVLLTSVSIGAFSSQTFASWSVKQDGPDVFGATKVVSVADAGNSSLVIQCDDKDELYIAYLMSKDGLDGQEIKEIPGELLIQVDGSKPIHLDASTRSWNEKYVAVATDGRSPEVISAIGLIKGARVRVNVGIKVGDAKDSASFDPVGSTSAMAKVISGCKLVSIPVTAPHTEAVRPTAEVTTQMRFVVGGCRGRFTVGDITQVSIETSS